MSLIGILFIFIGILFIVYPERIARDRLKGASDPTPTQGAINMVRYVGGPLLMILGFIMAFVTIQ
ncbi:hypothetical protein [Haladaptatus caseinilyticus]|uniref:hypothetical protein n=1 Tax=Haladaptatus caseinilyticus TaxID=2993314 RepID=UPI00224AE065|nr:hypothetical protein [Haladaptatus caseinilyticus]